ncbi:acyl carrier protein [Nocardia sp. NPDC058499]|uniref:acyl carrier protein n=1 Tax=Nocardia sp. NPDC058499 TaxID=3346530 RepID=UPI00365C4090
MKKSHVPNIDDIRTRLRGLLVAQFGPVCAEVPEDAILPEALGDRYDSLAALQCITTVEKEFGFEVDFVTHDVRHAFSRIDRIIQFIQERLEDNAVLEARL